MENLFKLAPPRYWAPTKGDMSKFVSKGVNDDNYVASKKIDGNQGRMTKQDGRVGILSRTEETVNKTKTGDYVDNYAKVPQFHGILERLPDNTQLLIELHQYGKTAKDVGAILRCLPPKAIERQNGNYGMIRAYLCDVIYFDGVCYKNVPYLERMKKVDEIFEEYFKENEYTDKNELVYENVLQQCFEWIAQGFEGGILCDKKAGISLGSKKSWTTIKIKGENLGNDMDFVITSVKKPNKQFEGKTSLENWKYFDEDGNPVTKYYALNMWGSLGIGLYDGNGELHEIGSVNSGLTDKIRSMPEEELVGRVCIIRSFSVDPNEMTLREAGFFGFHEEKNPEECLISDIF